MKVGQLSREELRSRLGSEKGLRVKFGPFIVRIQSFLPSLIDPLHRLYAFYALADDDIAEFHVQIVPKRSLRRPFTPLLQFLVDGQAPFPAAPVHQALTMLEWGINLAIAVRVNHFLLFHCAAVERNGHVLLLPAWPGSGKTTLCAALIHHGYRLFSDEFGLLELQSGHLFPLPRLMPLKNQAIDAIRNFLPEATLGSEIHGTLKGTVAHVRPPEASIDREDEPAAPRWIVFPKWIANQPLQLEEMPRSEAFLLLASNAFNYEVLGQSAFDAVTSLIQRCECRKLVYSDFGSVLAALNELTDG